MDPGDSRCWSSGIPFPFPLDFRSSLLRRWLGYGREGVERLHDRPRHLRVQVAVEVGGLARVLQGADEITSDVDICPQDRPENMRRLDQALGSVHGGERETADPQVREYSTDAGELSVVFEPTGIERGYGGLRLQARREPIGQGLRVQVADVPDLIRNLESLGRELDTSRAQHMREMVDIERALGRGRGPGMER
jgi:hypothetical protein